MFCIEQASSKQFLIVLDALIASVRISAMIEVETSESDDPSPPTPQATSNEQRGIMRAAILLSVGNVVSRMLGLIRESVKASLFGASPALSAFIVATFVPMSIFQLVIGGEMVNSALVPVFSEYAADDSAEKRKELWSVVSMFFSIAIFILLLCVIILFIFAPQIAQVQGADDFTDPEIGRLMVRWMRLASPAILFLSLASFISGVLYALKRFTFPAFVTATLNLSFIICAYAWGEVEGLVWGLLLGSILQIAIQLPALRDARLRWNLNWRHPAIRRIGLLYSPIVVGLIVNKLSEGWSFRLANELFESNVAFMGFATTLYQFPQGLIATALSIAILPTLSQQALAVDNTTYRETLASGLRLVLGLILPAAFGLFALAIPAVSLVFQRGAFTLEDTQMVSLMLRYYLFGLPFAAIDLMLVSASYARKDTWRPALVGVLSIGFYWIAALSLVDSLGILSLMVADAVKQITHVIMMLFILKRHVGTLSGYNVLPTLVKALIGSSVTAGAAWWVTTLIAPMLNTGAMSGKLIVVGVGGLVGVVTYLTIVYLLDLQEVKQLFQQVRRR